MLRWLASICALMISCAGIAQNGWLSVSGGLEHSFYTNARTEISSPSVEPTIGLRYRHGLGKKTSVWIGWRYASRSMDRSYEYFGHYYESSYEQIAFRENVGTIGFSVSIDRWRRSEVLALFSVEGHFPYSTKRTWRDQFRAEVDEGSESLDAPARAGFRCGIRYSRRLSERLWLTFEPHVMAAYASPSNEYATVPDHPTQRVYVGENRAVVGLDIGVEFGPLFGRSAQ